MLLGTKGKLRHCCFPAHSRYTERPQEDDALLYVWQNVVRGHLWLGACGLSRQRGPRRTSRRAARDAGQVSSPSFLICAEAGPPCFLRGLSCPEDRASCFFTAQQLEENQLFLPLQQYAFSGKYEARFLPTVLETLPSASPRGDADVERLPEGQQPGSNRILPPRWVAGSSRVNISTIFAEATAVSGIRT